jgi:hypothetical protein
LLLAAERQCDQAKSDKVGGGGGIDALWASTACYKERVAFCTVFAIFSFFHPRVQQLCALQVGAPVNTDV